MAKQPITATMTDNAMSEVLQKIVNSVYPFMIKLRNSIYSNDLKI